MQAIKILIILILILTFEAKGAKVEIFDQHLIIPDKYKLEVSSSLTSSKIIYRTGNFLRGSASKKLEIITIGRIEDYLSENELKSLIEVGDRVQSNERYNELKLNKSIVELTGGRYYRRFFHDEKHYIHYLVQDLTDVKLPTRIK